MGSEPAKIGRGRALAAFCALGAAAQVAQVLCLREVFVAFEGTETSLGLVLGVWLAGGALGSGLAEWRRSPDPGRAAGLVTACAAATAAAAGLLAAFGRDLRLLVGTGPGEYPSHLSLLLAAPLAILPASALLGAQFVASVHALAMPAERAYRWEALGALAAGLALTAVLLPACGPAQLAGAVAAAQALAVWGTAAPAHGRGATAAALALVLAAVAAAALGPRLDAWAARRAWARAHPAFNLVEEQETRAGRLSVVEYGGETSAYRSGKLLGSLTDHGEAAPLAHLALAQRPAPWPRSVLVLGAGGVGLTREILRHPGTTVRVIDADPAWLQLVRTRAAVDPARVRWETADPRAWLRAGTGRFDAVFVGAGDPTTLLAGRLATREFLAALRGILAPAGVALVGPFTSSDGYLDPDLARLGGGLRKTALEVFPHVLATAGTETFFVLSAAPLVADPDALAARLAQVGIAGVDLYAPLEADAVARVRAGQEAGAAGARAHTDAFPAALLPAQVIRERYAHGGSEAGLRLLQRFRPGWAYAAAAAATLLVLALGRRRAGPAAFWGVFAAGLGAMAAETLGLFSFQVTYGNVYQAAGGLTGGFMGGLAFGTRLRGRWTGAVALAALAGLALAPAALIEQVAGHVPDAALLALYGLCFVLSGAACGAAFTACVAGSERSGWIYAADLLGGAVAALLIAPVAVPVAGMTAAGGIAAAVCLSGAVGLVTGARRSVSSTKPGHPAREL